MKSWADIGFEIEITADQSPTLRLLEPNYPDAAHGESMHHSGGAATETLLIYGRPIEDILKQVSQPRFLIVGLGIGYIEMTIAREALLQGKTAEDVDLITSFESLPELREFFISWLWQPEVLHPEVLQIYDQIAQHLIQDAEALAQGLEISNIKDFLRPHFQSLDLVLGALDENFATEKTYHGIFYDAFSSKTTPHLWEEEFLVRFLQAFADPVFSQFSTYACRVSLKQALARMDFRLTIRPGFKSKRNSTLGIRP